MREQLISFETAKLAKEKGFDLNQKNWYDQIGGLNPRKGASGSMCYENIGYAPTQSLLQKFLREEKGISVDVFSVLKEKKVFQFGCDMTAFFKLSDEWHSFNLNKFFDTYEEALEAGLKKALELIK